MLGHYNETSEVANFIESKRAYVLHALEIQEHGAGISLVLVRIILAAVCHGKWQWDECGGSKSPPLGTGEKLE